MSLIDTDWQIRPLPDPRAEPGHHHRIRAQIIEEVAVHRHPLDAHDIGQHLGEDPLEGHGAVSASAVARLRIVGCW